MTKIKYKKVQLCQLYPELNLLMSDKIVIDENTEVKYILLERSHNCQWENLFFTLSYKVAILSNFVVKISTFSLVSQFLLNTSKVEILP